MLRQLLKTYREAKSYSDDGQVVLRFRQNGELIESKWKTAVRFERPNRLFVQAYQATLACDGKELRGRIEDDSTGDVDGQFLVRPAPKELRLKDLAIDPLLYDILSSQLRRQPIQLELLLESQGLASAFRGDVACKLLEDAQVEGQLCRRVEVPSPGGSFIFWVDAQSSLLRRLEYPAAALLPALAQDPAVKDISLTAELTGAEFNPAIPPEQFVLAIPAGAKKMKSLVMPPQPLPSDLFGQQTGDFFFTQLDGDKLQSQDLAGKIVVLTWFRNDPSCPPVLAQVEQARQELSKNAKVAFYAVSTDPTQLGNDDLAKLLSSWSVAMPVVRDLEPFGDSLFKIQVQPTVIVLDAGGRVQIVQAGGGPDLARQLGVILERLLKGDDVAAEILKRAEDEKAEYARLLATGGPEPTELLEIPETVIRKRSEPKRLKLEEIWTNKEIKSPGNICVVAEQGQKDRLLIFSGWRAVCEVSTAGKLQQVHELPIPPQAAVTYLRTAKDAAGKRHYLAAAPLSPAFFLLDENWELTVTHPAESQPLQLGDAQLARLAGTEELAVYAGYVDLAGLQAITLGGKTSWRSRTFPNVLSVAVTPGEIAADPGAGLLVTGDSGTVLRVSGSGKEHQPQTVKGFAMARVMSANFNGATQSPFLGIAGDEKGEAVAIGLDATLKWRWQYSLPAGGHQRPIEPVASGELLSARAGTWVIAGPDGSIHLLSEDGELTDSFFYGACITGIAVCKMDGAPALLVATDEGVTAWRVK
ncbi:MAG: TlpA family protein disulfide reductase [Pirellulaceae bacterium]|nr:TlpA family protein disulfide reductase [Pirellulaceae bacterium]